MKNFIIEEKQFFTTDKLESFAQAQASCADRNAMIANLSGINFKNFVRAFFENQASELRSYTLRIDPLNKSSEDCYGLVNVSQSNADKGLLGNAADVCRSDDNLAFKYNTLFWREQPHDANVSYIYIVISLLIVVVLAVFGFITYLKRQKNKFNDVESGEVRKNY